MPVGCLGVSSRSQAESSLYLDTMGTSGTPTASEDSAGKQAENLAMMQHKLLIQIFRVDTNISGGPQLSCSLCCRYSDRCCQVDSGWSVMADLVRVNSEAVWNMDLVRAVNSLKYQVKYISLRIEFYSNCNISLQDTDLSRTFFNSSSDVL